VLTGFIGLGANLGAPDEQLRRALAAIETLPDVDLVRRSRLYRSAPMGLPDQSDYCNAVCEVVFRSSPAELMADLLAIERSLGRFRDGRRWGPRMLALDLLHVVGVSCDEPALRLPHPGISRRNFVLVPLAEIAPELDIPGVGRVSDAAASIGSDGLQFWAESSQDTP